jgi:5-(carboxyamino)imidazole ribonucleotide synthase
MTIGVLGAGQLGQMLALAGTSLGESLLFLDPRAGSPAAKVGEQIVGAYDDIAKLEEVARRSQVVTYEFESVPVLSAQFLAERVPVHPPPRALEVMQDRWAEKKFFESLQIPTSPFACISNENDLGPAIETIGLPIVMKTRKLGYDGKGQAIAHSIEDAKSAFKSLGSVDVLAEKFVTFDRELSILCVAAAKNKELSFYPLVENRHARGILRTSIAPAPSLTRDLERAAEGYATRVANALSYVGTFAIELFETNGVLLANEMAPRVHNSGHWTIEGAETSQFENHLRAVLGLPLGSTAVSSPCAMINLIGEVPSREAILAVPGAHLHLYGKAPRAGRKLGHVTVRAPDNEQLHDRIKALRSIVLA